MRTKKCQYCREEIPNVARRCPKCGGNLGTPTWVKILIVVFVIFVFIIGFISACSNVVNDAVEDTKSSFKDINGKTSFKVNEPFQNKYEKITMTEVKEVTDYNKYLGPKDGNKIIALKFEVENISSDTDELYVSNFQFHAYADGVAADFFIYGSNKYEDLSATIGIGKKTIGYVLYEVPKDAQKITV